MNCITTTYFFSFIPGPWTPCSATCGPGRQSRELKCKVLLSFTQTEVELPDEECGEDRPPLERPCNMGSCAGGPGLSPPGALPGGLGDELHHWDYRGFTTCSATCAAGKQMVVVRCVDRRRGEEVADMLCDPSSRPTLMIRMCNPEPCPPSVSSSSYRRTVTSSSSSCTRIVTTSSSYRGSVTSSSSYTASVTSYSFYRRGVTSSSSYRRGVTSSSSYRRSVTSLWRR
ncbi:hypothetical protein NHX12_005595 [Muraenolepis orangiensis]|uniref:Uncharacterized protein n=1 Tax=Muraenolepis orangiensis TaxID=630683 RepID=A0A9Q0ICD8_9TELE|nr:hypothetical protein NHX12_005595 [Muraenolepis orangiensis]